MASRKRVAPAPASSRGERIGFQTAWAKQVEVGSTTRRGLRRTRLARPIRTVNAIFPEKIPMGLGILPLKLKTMLASIPLESRILVRRLAAGFG